MIITCPRKFFWILRYKRNSLVSMSGWERGPIGNCASLKFIHTDKRYTHKQSLSLENDSLGLWDANWSSDPASKTRLSKTTRRKEPMINWILLFQQIYRENENERKRKHEQILGSCLRAEEPKEHENGSVTNCGWCLWISLQRHGKEIWTAGAQKNTEDHPDHSTVKMS